MISIKLTDDGDVQTIYYGAKEGSEWEQIAESDFPTVNEDNVSKTYHWDGETLSVETEPIPDDDDDLI